MATRYIELVERLLKLTTNKKIEWRKTSSNNEYMLELGTATLAISKDYICYGEDTLVQIRLDMYNDKNMPIPLMSVMDGDDDFQCLISLYNVAEDSYTKETETIEKVLDELNRIDIFN